MSALDASVLIALLDEADVGRPVARTAVDGSMREHDLLIPVPAFSDAIVAPYRRSRRDRRWRGVDPRVRLLEP